ncbi:MAG: hypothetical protein FE78DRAFT_31483 [Acidomyces sp. 'richmondensis']|nr:MAG: hypothetical protein FE78DRAFT_31483 [Acidomyces sp. 'richmondensis']
MGEYNSALPNSAIGGINHNPQSTEKKKLGKRQSRHCCKNTDQRKKTTRMQIAYRTNKRKTPS